MTLICISDPDIWKMYSCTKVNFLGQDFQKLWARSGQTQTDRQMRPNTLPLLYSWVVTSKMYTATFTIKLMQLLHFFFSPRHFTEARPTCESGRQVSSVLWTARLFELRESCLSSHVYTCVTISVSPRTLCCRPFSSSGRQSWENTK